VQNLQEPTALVAVVEVQVFPDLQEVAPDLQEVVLDLQEAADVADNYSIT